MADQRQSEIIHDNPIGDVCDYFRASFKSTCEAAGLPSTPDSLEQLSYEDLKDLTCVFLDAAWDSRAADLLPAVTRDGPIILDLGRLLIKRDELDLDCLKPVLEAALADDRDDALIWDRVVDAIAECTWLIRSSSFSNPLFRDLYLHNHLEQDIGPMYVDLGDFDKTYLGHLRHLEAASRKFFERCRGGSSSSSSPVFDEDGGWKGWPEEARLVDMRNWLVDFTEKLEAFAHAYAAPAPRHRRLAEVARTGGEHKMEIGFVEDASPRKRVVRYNQDMILVFGVLKSDPSDDTPAEARLDLGRFVMKVLRLHDTRRFALGFTLCGSLMRVWEFDRLGAIASDQFDINKDGLRFVSTMLGFLRLRSEGLGFDPTIKTTADGCQRFVEVERNGTTERLILHKLIQNSSYIASRGTTCWKAYREGDPDAVFVVKDSWHHPECHEEGALLREAHAKGVVRVARYYHHETVQVRNTDDDVRNNVRKGLDVTKATNYSQNGSQGSASPSMSSRNSLSLQSDQADAPAPPRKRRRLATPTKTDTDAPVLPNRVHRRVIVADYGYPIYRAKSREVLPRALADCIEGHESLRQKAGLLHRDISIGNLMIGEDNRGFLIDLDHAIKEEDIGSSSSSSSSTSNDAEKSFFWVLVWICIHCEGPGEATRSNKWPESHDDWDIACEKIAVVIKDCLFADLTERFTPYHRPMVPWVDKLRKVVFPLDNDGQRLSREDNGLYGRMREILEEARKEFEGKG